MKYFLVCCYVGHCGRKRFDKSREIALAIEAKDCTQAMMIAKNFPGVKHNNSKYMCSSREITREEYIERRKNSAYDRALRKW